jgi:hypothetical protein
MIDFNFLQVYLGIMATAIVALFLAVLIKVGLEELKKLKIFHRCQGTELGRFNDWQEGIIVIHCKCNSCGKHFNQFIELV